MGTLPATEPKPGFQAAQNPAQQATERQSTKSQLSPEMQESQGVLQPLAIPCEIVNICPMEAAGIEPSPISSGKIASSDQGGAKSGAVVVIDRDLGLLLDTWATLPEAIKAGIVAMVRSAARQT